MKRKVKVNGEVFAMVANELRRRMKGFRGLSSKNKRKHEKNVKKVIPLALEWYIREKRIEEMKKTIRKIIRDKNGN